MKGGRRSIGRTFVAALGAMLLAATAYPAPSNAAGKKLTLEAAVRIALEEHPAMSIASFWPMPIFRFENLLFGAGVPCI